MPMIFPTSRIDRMDLLILDRNNDENVRDCEDITLLLLQLLNVVDSVYAEVKDVQEALRRNPRYSETIMSWIEKHYQDDVSLENLAKETHLSTSYISRVFRRDRQQRNGLLDGQTDETSL